MTIVLDSEAAKNVDCDLSDLRGTATATEEQEKAVTGDDDLNALSELVPSLKKGADADQTTAGKGNEETQDNGINSPRSPLKDNKQLGEDDVVKQVNSMAKGSYASGNAVDDASSSDDDGNSKEVNEVLYGTGELEDIDSDRALSSDHSKPRPANETDPYLGITNEFQNISSGQSLSTATQTHDVQIPMSLPTFKPATGCTNASDFIVRCFVARLRAGITVVKHGRSRWCKSRLRILHIHKDGRSLSWKPAEGEPTSSKRPPKLDLMTCTEVRHAWSPDPQNPMYTGTPTLRQKCEAANAHKSFALIFPKRTVDITSVTADQCKVLMEGFSALCFRLQVANGSKKGAQRMPEEEEVASVTLTNTSTKSNTNAKVRR